MHWQDACDGHVLLNLTSRNKVNRALKSCRLIVSVSVSGVAMSEEGGEGGETRMGDIVLFASWHQDEEDEEEEEEGGKKTPQEYTGKGLKRSKQDISDQGEEATSTKRARRTTEDLIFGIPANEEENEVEKITEPILEIANDRSVTPTKRIVLEKKSNLMDSSCDLDDEEIEREDDKDAFDRLLPGNKESNERENEWTSQAEMFNPRQKEKKELPPKRDLSPGKEYSFTKSEVLLLPPEKFKNLLGTEMETAKSENLKTLIEKRHAENKILSEKMKEIVDSHGETVEKDAVIDISDEDEGDFRKKAGQLEISDEEVEKEGALEKTKPCKVLVRKLTRWETKHGKVRVKRAGVRRKGVLEVLERMYDDQDGHLWSRVEAETDGGVDKEASVLVDLIEQHVRDCAACRKNPAFSCSGQSSRHQLESKVKALEEKVEQLKLKLRRVEREVAEEDEEVTSSLLSGVSRPKLLANTEYIVASGLRLVDLGVVRRSLGNDQP